MSESPPVHVIVNGRMIVDPGAGALVMVTGAEIDAVALNAPTSVPPAPAT